MTRGLRCLVLFAAVFPCFAAAQKPRVRPNRPAPHDSKLLHREIEATGRKYCLPLIDLGRHQVHRKDQGVTEES